PSLPVALAGWRDEPGPGTRNLLRAAGRKQRARRLVPRALSAADRDRGWLRLARGWSRHLARPTAPTAGRAAGRPDRVGRACARSARGRSGNVRGTGDDPACAHPDRSAADEGRREDAEA